MHHVFVSYSRADADRVLPMVDALRSVGVDVWIDQRDIEVSVPWMDEITLAIEGAGAVLVFESLSWYGSAACVAELDIAETLAVPVLRFDVHTESQETVVAETRRYLASRSSIDRIRTELLVRASIWARQGRARSQLVGGRTLTRYRGLAIERHPGTAQLPLEVHQFLGASKQRQRRKRMLRFGGTALVALVLLVGLVSYLLVEVADRQFEETTTKFDWAEAARGVDSLNPYLHMERLALYKPQWEVAQWESSTAALDPVLPIRRESVETDQGRGLLESAVPESASSPDGRYLAKIGAGAEIDIAESATGSRYRTLRTTQRPRGLTWSPDGRWLAVGSSRDVVLLDVEHGVASRLLFGGAGTVEQVRWTADGRTVIARTASNRVLAWDVSVGTSASFGNDRFVDLARMPQTGELAVLTDAGSVLVLDPDRLTIAHRIELGTGTRAARLRISPDGSHLAFLSIGPETEIILYGFARRDVTRIPLPKCNAADIDFGDDAGASLLVACANGGIRYVEPNPERTSVHQSETGYTAVARRGDTIYAGTYLGSVQRFEGPSADPEEFDGELIRTLTVTGIVVSDDGRVLVHRGGAANNGVMGANRMFDLTADPVPSYALIFAGQSVGDSRAVAVSPDGKLVAHGFDDGSVWIRDIWGGYVVQRLQPFTGAVRGLSFAPDGQHLAIVGEEGHASLVDLTVARESEMQRRERFVDLVVRAKELELYRNALPPELQRDGG